MGDNLRTEFGFSHGEWESKRGSATVTIEGGGAIPNRMALDMIAASMLEMGVGGKMRKDGVVNFTIDSGVQNWRTGPDGQLQDAGMTGYRVSAERYEGNSNADYVGRIEQVERGRIVDVDYFSANVEQAPKPLKM
jgi:hypothetical protein